MAFFNRLDCRGSHVLVECDGRFAVVEERNGKIYGLDPRRRRGYPDTPDGIAEAVGSVWQSEIAATRLFDEVTREAERLARRIW